MAKSGSLVPLHPRGDRAQAVIDTVSLYYRAEIAEALLSENPPPRAEKLKNRDGKVIPSTVEVILSLHKKTEKQKRRKLARLLVSRDPKTRKKLGPRDRAFMRSAIEPNSKTPFSKRNNLPQILAGILRPAKPFDGKDKNEIESWLIGVVREFYPGTPMDLDDGRPEDAEPDNTDNPPPTGNGNPTTPGTSNPPPWSALEFVVERVRCLDSTNGEWGADEIWYDGIATDGPLAIGSNPSSANSVGCQAKFVGSFVTGQSHPEVPHNVLHSYPLTGFDMPHLFGMAFAMAESDPGGGFAGYMNALNSSITAELSSNWVEVLTLVGTAAWAGTIAGGYIGGLVGGPWGLALGAGIGLSVALNLSAVYASIAMNQDDIFDVQVLPLVLDQESLGGWPFHGSDRTPTTDLLMTGDGGLYEVKFYWQLTGPISVPPIDQD